jgi:transposase
MNQNQPTLQAQNTTKPATLYIAFEMGNLKWKLAFGDGGNARQINLEARDLAGFREQTEKARLKFGLPEGVRIVSCYEAGRDGFWLHRFLTEQGIENLVVDSSSIEVNRRARRSKTDRLDAAKLLRMLVRYESGERGVWSVVRVPGEPDEDRMRLHRELGRLKKEHTQHGNRIRSLLALRGLKPLHVNRKLKEELAKMRDWRDAPLPPDLRAELERECDRWCLVHQQILTLKGEREKRLAEGQAPQLEKVQQLKSLRGIGEEGSWVFTMELFGWRHFDNRKQLGSQLGLTPTPYDSGQSSRELGISKAGSPRLRALAVEIAWKWLTYQPDSKLSRWFMERFGTGGARMRKVGIVALARKLVIALWRYLEYGVVPEGARLKTA